MVLPADGSSDSSACQRPQGCKGWRRSCGLSVYNRSGWFSVSNVCEQAPDRCSLREELEAEERVDEDKDEPDELVYSIIIMLVY